MLTDYHAKLFAHELTKRFPSDSVEKFTATLMDSQVDLNPHQVDAALFAFRSPLSKGAILADEVGLGKTIEAGIVLAQKWAERKRKILLILPSSLRKQWHQELQEKFYLPSMILEGPVFNKEIKKGAHNPFDRAEIVICSYYFARNKAEFVRQVPWDLVVIDEAHRLRNVYKSGNKIARELRRALTGVPKLLLTATPLQNTLLELYGLVSFIDEHVFGDFKSYKTQFARLNGFDEFEDLKERLKPVCKRTLRRQVQPYISYTERQAYTQDFVPTPDEQVLYDMVSEYLCRENLMALPASQRSLMTLIMRKLLASSTFAIAGALNSLANKLERMLKEDARRVAVAQEIEDDFEAYGEYSDELEIPEDEPDPVLLTPEEKVVIQAEIQDLRDFYELAMQITQNAKGEALLQALQAGFKMARDLGGAEKAVIFTESRRTQNYVLQLLSENGYDLPAPRPDLFFVYVIECDDGSHYIGQTEDLQKRWSQHKAGNEAEWTKKHKPVKIAHYEKVASRREAVEREKWLKTGFGRKWIQREIKAGRARQAGGKIVLFNGTNTDPIAKQIYADWKARNEGTDKVTGSRTADTRAALVDHFRNHAEVMIATEAAAEGINLQFCSLVVNYDLPWNPQRIEQRIGRCHRYGQKHDVVVVNFLNRNNAADRRVFELLDEKFKLFKGVFGASDEVLGAIESGVDFEKRIVEIYQSCRSPEQIQEAFDLLQEEMSGQIDETLKNTRQKLLENFDTEVAEKLRVYEAESLEALNRYEALLWRLTKHQLDGSAEFNDEKLCFAYQNQLYSLKSVESRQSAIMEGTHHYRLNHSLAQKLVEDAKNRHVEPAAITFGYSGSGKNISILQPLIGKRGTLAVSRLSVDALETEDYLLFAGITDDGQELEQEQCRRLFDLPGIVKTSPSIDTKPTGTILKKLTKEKLVELSERNAVFFEEEMEKLDKWADDRRKSLKVTLKDHDDQIKELKKEARTALNLPKKLAIQKKIRKIESKRDEAWREYDQASRDIEVQKDQLIDTVEEQLKQRTSESMLFNIQWKLC